MNSILRIEPSKEAQRIEAFIRSVMKRVQKQKVLVAVSGGIDSAVSATLATRSLGKENVYVVMLPYKGLNKQGLASARLVASFLHIPENQIYSLNIGEAVYSIVRMVSIKGSDNLRMGNIMARVRMILLFDFAKKFNGLVCGTENRSEYLLGYYTRFGDEASDIEPILHLYKTQVYQLAEYLGIPQEIRGQAPTAGLWQGQTDESELGFTYAEADEVFYRHLDKKELLESIHTPHATSIIACMEKSSYKHKVPYTIEKKGR